MIQDWGYLASGPGHTAWFARTVDAMAHGETALPSGLLYMLMCLLDLSVGLLDLPVGLLDLSVSLLSSAHGPIFGQLPTDTNGFHTA